MFLYCAQLDMLRLEGTQAHGRREEGEEAWTGQGIDALEVRIKPKLKSEALSPWIVQCFQPL